MHIQLLFVLSTLVVTSLAHSWQLDDLWTSFMTTYSKDYQDNQEEYYRRKVWEDNVDYIQRHNLLYDMGQFTYTLGINEYADLTHEEYKIMCGFRPGSKTPGQTFDFHVHSSEKKHLPRRVDWREKGYVTPVKNQGNCGSCWAFSSTGALEGQHFAKTGQLVSLSEQNLVDCSSEFGNAGCKGGWMDSAFKYVIANHGIDTEAAYPYETKNLTCRFDSTHIGSDCKSFVDIAKGSEHDLKRAVASVGPIAVAIDAAHRSFQLYKTGVYSEPDCSNTSTDHAVLAVGYGALKRQPYWLVKNSWGTSWGTDGYIMMARNQNNMCAIASFATFPVV